jgi:L-asparaginase II
LDHPVQQEVTRRIAQVCEIEPSALIPGTDGCAAPNLAMPLKNLAVGFAKMATPASLPDDLQDAARRLAAAVGAHPRLMSGTDRACAELIEATGARALVKIGAEGVYTGMVPSLGLGIALKIDDGAFRGAEIAITALLVALGVLDGDSAAAQKWMCPPWLNTRDEVVGAQRPAEILKAPITH